MPVVCSGWFFVEPLPSGKFEKDLPVIGMVEMGAAAEVKGELVFTPEKSENFPCRLCALDHAFGIGPPVIEGVGQKQRSRSNCREETMLVKRDRLFPADILSEAGAKP